MAGASEEAMALMRDEEGFQSMFEDDVSLVSTLAFMQDLLDSMGLVTLQEGMDVLPKALLINFLMVSSRSASCLPVCLLVFVASWVFPVQ